MLLCVAAVDPVKSYRRLRSPWRIESFGRLWSLAAVGEFPGDDFVAPAVFFWYRENDNLYKTNRKYINPFPGFFHINLLMLFYQYYFV